MCCFIFNVSFYLILKWWVLYWRWKTSCPCPFFSPLLLCPLCFVPSLFILSTVLFSIAAREKALNSTLNSCYYKLYFLFIFSLWDKQHQPSCTKKAWFQPIPLNLIGLICFGHEVSLIHGCTVLFSSIHPKEATDLNWVRCYNVFWCYYVSLTCSFLLFYPLPAGKTYIIAV